MSSKFNKFLAKKFTTKNEFKCLSDIDQADFYYSVSINEYLCEYFDECISYGYEDFDEIFDYIKERIISDKLKDEMMILINIKSLPSDQEYYTDDSEILQGNIYAALSYFDYSLNPFRKELIDCYFETKSIEKVLEKFISFNCYEFKKIEVIKFKK